MKTLFTRTLARWFDRRTCSDKSKAIPRNFRPDIDALEDRQLMSVSPLAQIGSLTLTQVTPVIVTVNGTEGADVVAIKSSVADPTKMEIFLNNVSKGVVDPLTTSGVKINGLGGDDQVSISYLYSVVPITIDGGSGTNTLLDQRPFAGEWDINGVNSGTLGYGSTTQYLSFLQMQNLTGGSLSDRFVFANAGQINGTIQGGAGANEFDFRHVDSLWVNAYEGGNVVGRVAVMRGITSFVGNDTGAIRAGNYENIWDLASNDSRSGNDFVGSISVAPPVLTTATYSAARTTSNLVFTPIYTTPPTIQFSHFASLFGGDSSDTFKIGDYSLSRAGMPFLTINGTGGTNSLDFTTVTRDLYINLSTNTTTYMEYARGAVEEYFNMYSFTNVYGGSGNDIIIGNNVANLLDGGAGDDVLIGRDGADTLLGGYGNDALIGGFTDFDLDAAGLRGFVRHRVETSSGSVITIHYVNQVRDDTFAFDNYVRGDRFSDVLIGGPGNDTFYLWAPAGGMWNDVFDGSAGDYWTYSINAPI